MKFRSCVLPLFVVLVVAVGADRLALSQGSQVPLTMTEEELRKIARAFLEPTSDLKALLDLPATVTTVEANDHSLLYRVVASGSYGMTVRSDTRSVEYAYFGSRSVRAHVMRTPDGRTVDKQIFESELAKVGREDAEKTARRFVTDRCGSSALDGLELQAEPRTDVGEGFEYRFFWLNPPNANGVQVGTRSFTVVVNPVTGEVSEYTSWQNVVTLTPVRTADEAWKLAQIRLAQERGVSSSSRVGTRLVQTTGTDGSSRLTWLVKCEVVSQQGFIGHPQVSVDDNTGEVTKVEY